MEKDKTKGRRILELIVVAAIVVCVALVLVELTANVRGELSKMAMSRALSGAGAALGVSAGE